MDIARVVISIRPGAEWVMNGDLYEGLQWRDAVQIKPTLAEIQAAWPAVQAQIAADAARLTTDAAEQAAVKADAQVQAFLNMTPAQLDAWLATNVNGAGLTLAQVKANLATALGVLGRIALAAGRGRTLR